MFNFIKRFFQAFKYTDNIEDIKKQLCTTNTSSMSTPRPGILYVEPHVKIYQLKKRIKELETENRRLLENR